MLMNLRECHPSLTGENFDGDVVAVRPTDGVATLIVFWLIGALIAITRFRNQPDSRCGGMAVWASCCGVSTAVAPQRPNFPPQRWLAEKDWIYDVIADAYDADRSTFIVAEAFGVPIPVYGAHRRKRPHSRALGWRSWGACTRRARYVVIDPPADV